MTKDKDTVEIEEEYVAKCVSESKKIDPIRAADIARKLYKLRSYTGSYPVDDHLGCYSYPNCDEDWGGCCYGGNEPYGNR